jgi:hypothetical protein
MQDIPGKYQTVISAGVGQIDAWQVKLQQWLGRIIFDSSDSCRSPGFVKLVIFRKIDPATNAFLLNRHTSPAAKFEMIDSSTTDIWLHQANVDPRERDYEAGCELPEIAAPVQVI